MHRDHLTEKAREVVSGLFDPAVPEATRAERLLALRPRPGDCERVFSDHVASAQRYYDAWWAKPPVLAPSGGRLELHRAAPADLLVGESQFPGGYRHVVGTLTDLSWFAWDIGDDSFDGLVWLGDRFVWLPQPWLALEGAV